ncbi:preprotein translocase subunit YajC [Candidatus Persebacteraceae bacterium Df01]|jgi:preprotein translocase subunit YajC|uniref:Sec translocon accessory complex subunit YajC n=1 Tax=Candidatus Doriopsillibacter californiensis TaxID=2970740 RepID=A0ABT7QKJ0_9GAMM|nr:preprotein translocase subunit YajC [Candidatus Persebacteraceae bacterium Df01]
MIDIAYAQSGAAPEGSALTSFLPLILIVIIFYFMLIRPQQKNAKAHRNMLAALSVGDEVVTSSGIFGKVTKINDGVVVINTGKVEIAFQKQAIQSLLPAGSIEKI